jgi:hypothetical protein
MNDEVRTTHDDKSVATGARPAGTVRPETRHSKVIVPLLAWVGAAFLLLALAWSVLFTVARSVKVESVPLATKEAKP